MKKVTKNKVSENDTARKIAALVSSRDTLQNKIWELQNDLKEGDDIYNESYRTMHGVGSRLWQGDSVVCRMDRALGNCHPSKEAAEVWRDKLLADYK